MKRFSLIAAAAMLGAFLPVSLQAAEIEYVGSSTVGKFLTDAAKVYGAATVKLDTKPESSGGESCPVRGACQMGGVARDVNPEYLDQGVVPTMIGKDAIAVIVHESNPVKDLTPEQLHGIFTGKITNWSEVGGPDLAIKPLIVKKGSATRKVFRKVILGEDDYAGAKVVTPDAKIVSTVARDPAAIGQISLAFVQGNAKVAAIAVGGQAASVDNSSYPITRPLFLTTNGTPTPEVQAFLDWALSPEGQAVVKQRFVGVN